MFDTAWGGSLYRDQFQSNTEKAKLKGTTCVLKLGRLG